jgi:hypothetical protein
MSMFVILRLLPICHIDLWFCYSLSPYWLFIDRKRNWPGKQEWSRLISYWKYTHRYICGKYEQMLIFINLLNLCSGIVTTQANFSSSMMALSHQCKPCSKVAKWNTILKFETWTGNKTEPESSFGTEQAPRHVNILDRLQMHNR